MSDQLVGIVLAIGHDERLVGWAVEDSLCHLQQSWRCLGNGWAGSGKREAQGLTGVGIEAEESLAHLQGFAFGAVPALAHLSFAVTANAMRVEGEQLPCEMAIGSADTSQSDLEVLSVGDCVGGEKAVNSRATDDKGQAIGQLEASLAQRTELSSRMMTQGCFVNKL